MVRGCRGIAAALVVAGAALLPVPARADITPEEMDRGPDAGGRADRDPQSQNPLPAIVELMRQVQQRLIEADTSRSTQQRQQRIVKALELGDQALQQLGRLIELAEEQAQQSSGGGGEAQRQAGSSGQQQRRQMRERERMENTRPAAPDRQQGGQQHERNERAGQNDQRRLERSGGDPGSEARGAGRDRQPSEAERWGDLPMKQVREVLDTRRHELPARWRAALEAYYKRLAELED
ncbi:MAG: hypothetical protein KatS3mg102_1892 [Planctomycetota bacterium]|nr:MAG: hypothetical protein KatS3mg102_1892 [Planctomycetota bacterium]